MVNGEPDNLEVICKNVQNPERMIRQKALKDLLSFCVSEEIEKRDVVEVFDSCYLYILKCYSDKFETCRSFACTIVSELLERLPENDFYLGYIIPVLTKRIGQSEIIEESEELRLELVKQLLQMVNKFKTEDRLLKSYNDIMDILIKTLRDPYPAVQRESCEVIKILSEESCFHYRAEALVNPLIAILRHRHSANRIAAISALGFVCLNIHSNGECVGKIIMELSPLLMDDIPYVRRECGRVGCLLAMKLRDRYSFFDRILPLVFCCLMDETVEVRSEIQESWKKCGELYFQENENELSKTALMDHKPENYPENIERPTIGCRAIMQRSLLIFKIITHEMQDWKEDVRLHSLKLLGQAVIHCETALTPNFLEIFPVLSNSCWDHEQTVINEAIRVAGLIGRLLDYKSWNEHALKYLNEFKHLGCLKCFGEMHQNSKIDERKVDLFKICEILTDSVFCNSVDEKIQLEVLRIVGNLTNDSEFDEKTEFLLYKIVMNVLSISADSGKFNEIGSQILSKLSENVRELHKKHLNSLIGTIEDLDGSNSDRAEPILLLYGYIRFAGFQSDYLTGMKEAIVKVLENGQPEGKIKIFTAISVAMLDWNQSINSEKSCNLLENFIDEIIVPSLIWKAGKSSESLRTMATACLCSITQGAPEESEKIFPKLTTQFVALIEDNSIATRNYALKCILHLQELPFDYTKNLINSAIARLDDQSSDVRILAAQCLGNFEVQGDPAAWDPVVRMIFKTIFLHIEDPEIKLRSKLLESLKKLAFKNKEVFMEFSEHIPPSIKNDVEQIKNEIQ